MANPFDVTTFETDVPETIIKGRFTGWRYPVGDFIEDLYSTSVQIIAGETPVNIIGEQVDDYWIFKVPSATSSAWEITSGTEARWDLIVEETVSTNTVIIGSGRLTIFDTNADRRSYAEIMIAKIESILNGRADSDVSSYSIKTRSISKMGVEELMKWRDRFREELREAGGTQTGLKSHKKKNTLLVGFK